MPPSCSCSFCHPLALRSGSGCLALLSLSMLFYCSSFDSFSLTLCTSKHRKGICTYLSSYLPRLHNKLGYARLSRNLYIDHVRLSRNLHVQYVRFSINLYVHYVRLRPTFHFTTSEVVNSQLYVKTRFQIQIVNPCWMPPTIL